MSPKAGIAPGTGCPSGGRPCDAWSGQARQSPGCRRARRAAATRATPDRAGRYPTSGRVRGPLRGRVPIPDTAAATRTLGSVAPLPGWSRSFARTPAAQAPTGPARVGRWPPRRVMSGGGQPGVRLATPRLAVLTSSSFHVGDHSRPGTRPVRSRHPPERHRPLRWPARRQRPPEGAHPRDCGLLRHGSHGGPCQDDGHCRGSAGQLFDRLTPSTTPRGIWSGHGGADNAVEALSWAGRFGAPAGPPALVCQVEGGGVRPSSRTVR